MAGQGDGKEHSAVTVCMKVSGASKGRYRAVWGKVGNRPGQDMFGIIGRNIEGECHVLWKVSCKKLRLWVVHRG